MTPAVWFGLIGCALLIATAFAVVLPLRRLPMAARFGVLAAVLAAMLVPWGQLPAAAYVRGFAGDLSITTVMLLAATCWGRATGRAPIEPSSRALLMALVAPAALVLYPLSLGVGPLDPYASGYGSPVFLAALLAIALAAWYRRRYLIAMVILAASVGWLAGVYDSRNLWDYLLDPLLGIYALGWWVVTGVRRWRAGPRTAGTPSTKTP